MKNLKSLSSFILLAVSTAALFHALPVLADANEMFGGNAESFAETSGLASFDLVLFIARLIRGFIGFLGIIAVGIIIYGGYVWVTAGGETDKILKAKKILRNGLIGLVIILSSFAIAQFVISSITASMGGGVSVSEEDEGAGGGDVPPDASRYFYLESLNDECASVIRNLELQFVFSQAVDVPDINSNSITIIKSGSEEVDGVFAAANGSTDSARVFTFTPTQTCAVDSETTVNCFDESTAYEVNISESLQSSSSRDLQCSTSYPCQFDFVTGTGFDLTAPTLTITDPEDGDSAYSGSVENLQTRAVDDSGVSSVTFTLDSDDLDTAGVDESNEGELALDNYFNGEWDTAGYLTNEDYDIGAYASDCGGNDVEAVEISVILRAASCDNETQDEGEDGVDCGGDSSSDDYCGACGGSSCDSDDDCASGSCEDGTCEEDVEIERVSPGDGAVGNLITVSGEGFGTEEGTVTFLGDTTTESDDLEVAAYAGCSGTWSDDEVIVQVPDGAVDGPLQLTTSGNEYDRTDDDNGPTISDFDVNDTARPGLCSLTPSTGEGGDEVVVAGLNFGETQGEAILYFDSYEPDIYDDWSDTSFTIVVPALDSGEYDIQLFTGESDDRQGSNELTFIVATESEDEPPVISEVDSGISRCADTGEICSDSSQCGEAECEEDSDAGPIGQYVTIYGSNFGTSEGTARFRDQSTGYEALGDTSFPDECEATYWDDDMIVIKVPETYYGSSDALSSTTHDLWVVRTEDGEESEPVDFEVISGQAAPGICAIEPDSGPVGTEVVLYGEGFGTATGTVTFYDGQTTTSATDDWSDEEIADVSVPTDAATGPVFITDNDGQESNSVNFEVGVCDEDFTCSADEECCASGICSAADCVEVPAVSHYAYYFSTGDIPEAPEVVESCVASSTISPTPWERWERGDEVCLNAVLHAEFTENMDTSTFTSSTIVVEKCASDDCSATSVVIMDPATAPATTSETSFDWSPAEDWEADVRYRVTILGGEEAAYAVESDEGLRMLDDYSWEFVTSESGEECEIGDVLVTPAETTATELRAPVTFSAAPVAAEYQCILLNCSDSDYDWDFSSSREDLAEIQNETGCQAQALPLTETDEDSGPVVITGEETNTGLDDFGLLYISFIDPRITDYWPDCEEACLNAEIGATFNIDLRSFTFSGYDSNGLRKVRLNECEDPACAYDELSDVTIYMPEYNVETKTLSVTPRADLEPDTYYRMIISGETASLSGSTLAEGETELLWQGDASWVFATKAEECDVDSVGVEPASVTLEVVGASQRFTAVPYGSPDACSADGQRLTASDYDWDAWTAADDPDNDDEAEVAELLDDGAISVSDELPEYCSSSCLLIGSPALSAVCGNGDTETGEDCDDSNTDDSDGCSSICLNEGSSATCGNGSINSYEECDDGDTTSGDGCSSLCLNEGASAIEADCGDGEVAGSTGIGGEECDWGNDNAENNCSSECLNMGSTPLDGLYAVCGNGDIEDGEECDGGDGCSSDCLNEGSTITCGNGGDPDPGEDCDDSNTDDGDGCSSDCLNEGASDNYSTPSICGDGEIETGEECESEGTLENASFSLAFISNDAPQEVLASGTNTASATITATESTTPTVEHTGDATLSLECACTSDYNCDTTGEDYGCGTAGCCFARPITTAAFPADDASGICRNTAVWMSFDQLMDAEGIANGGSLYLEYTEDANSNAVTASTCPDDYTASYASDNSRGWLARAWHWMRNNILRIFNASAVDYQGCLVPVTYDLVESGSGSIIYLDFISALEAGGTYQLVVLGEEDGDPTDGTVDGAVSANGVAVYDGLTHTFVVGSEICSLDMVTVEDQGKTDVSAYEDPSEGVFTEEDEEHTLFATAYTLDGALAEEIQGVDEYNWSWNWGDESDVEVIEVTDADSQTAAALALGSEGEETVTATAAVTDTTSETETTDTISGSTSLTAIMCENLWPDEDDDGYFPFQENYSNFSFYYCRDQEDTSELLPALSVVETPSPPVSDILQEVLFLVDETSDAIGVRILPNEDYLSPADWYEAQDFVGSPSETTLDSYEAVRDGNTYYVSAVNVSSGVIYPNIYVISWNEDAGDETEEITEQILSNWSFNANDDEVTDENVCAIGSEYQTDDSGDLISCDWDEECREETGDDAAVCDAEKAKLTRDLKRLTDLREIASVIVEYGEENRHCAVTIGQSCEEDEDCPGEEECVPEVPALQSGTFLSAFTTSTWPSWSAELGNALGTALSSDPLNEFVDCPTDSNETYCWDSATGVFTCYEGSHAYIYRSIGSEEYELAAQMENDDGQWAYDFDDDSTDNVSLYVEYSPQDTVDASMDGFSADGELCDGSFGASARCGDGVQGSDEECEVGDTDTVSCATPDGETGTISVSCPDTCSWYNTDAEAEAAAEAGGAECVPYECGNGVIDLGETCDDGSRNGDYGYCDENCSLDDAFYCGDGYLAGDEECDCGDDDNIMDDENSWAYNNDCAETNGQYTGDYEHSCAYNCAFPGPSCGDAEVNGPEECDGENESWSGALCSDGESCSTDSDCSSGDCDDGGAACPIDNVCEGGTYDGQACSTSGCGTDGLCSSYEYQLARYRTCDDEPGATCDWNDWSVCLGGEQACGNGEMEGDEECDDGNDDSSDDCTELCTLNVCGDGYKYDGYETCDEGIDNGGVCSPDYGDTCVYCNVNCQYTTVSGAYCGDEVIQEDEYCDALDMPMYCFDADLNPDERAYDTEFDCSEYSSAYTDGDAYCAAVVGTGYTCENVGVCDGGIFSPTAYGLSSYEYNGAPCVADGSSSAELCGTDASGDAGTCAGPVCADDCSETCPFRYDSTSILIQTELAGASTETEADLYSFTSTESPNSATLYVPACSVGTQITADIDTTNIEPPSIDVVFVTDLSGSMAWSFGGDEGAAEGSRRIDYAVAAIRDSIEELFETNDNLRVALVSYAGTDAEQDAEFTDSSGEYDLIYNTTYGLASYPDRTGGATPTATGLEEARQLLDESSADYKVTILLSDGQANRDLDGDNDSAQAMDDAYGVVHDATGSLDYLDALTYTAALTSDADLISFMTYLSSDDCDTTTSGWDSATYSDASERCEPSDYVEYAYAGNSEEELEGVYQTIIESLLGVSVGLQTDVAGETTITVGTVEGGEDVVLPFPEGFDCDETAQWTIPVRLSFSGEGTINISDIKLTYCSPESAVASETSATDLDSDDDGFDDSEDNCPGDYNPSQTDADGDGIGAECDDDDTVSTAVESACGDGDIDTDEGEYCDGSAFPDYCFLPHARYSSRVIVENTSGSCSSGYVLVSGENMGVCSSSSASDNEPCIVGAVALSRSCGAGLGVSCEANTCESDCANSSVGRIK